MRVLIILILIFLYTQVSAYNIKDYKIFTAVCIDKESRKYFFSLRKYFSSGKVYLLLVNPDNLETQLSPFNHYKVNPKPMGEIRKSYKNTRYVRTLAFTEKNSSLLHNAGIIRFSPYIHGVFITVDFCPSNKSLDRVLFIELIKAFENVQMTVPVALSLSGRWLGSHNSDIEWIRDLVNKGKIAVTWINHSYNHRSNEKLPLDKNFLLIEKTDISFETLETEKAMINSGLIPSVFFRFPGLVSNFKIFHQITGYGLIPVGSDSWLSKNQSPKYGSIILVHGNGNDPEGIKRLCKLLEIHRESIAKKYWNVYDIREGAEKLK